MCQYRVDLIFLSYVFIQLLIGLAQIGCTLFDHLLELLVFPAYSAYLDTVAGKNNQYDEQYNKGIKPVGLPEGRNDPEDHRSSGLIPVIVIIGGFYPKAIGTRIQIHVSGVALIADIVPVRFKPFHHESIAVLFRHGIVQSDILESQDILPMSKR